MPIAWSCPVLMSQIPPMAAIYAYAGSLRAAHKNTILITQLHLLDIYIAHVDPIKTSSVCFSGPTTSFEDDQNMRRAHIANQFTYTYEL